MEEDVMMNNEETLTEEVESSNGWTPLEVAILVLAGIGDVTTVKKAVTPVFRWARGKVSGVLHKKDKKAESSETTEESVNEN